MPYLCGIDENGLGPKLGPLVVTAALLRVESGQPKELWRRFRAAVRARPLRAAGLEFGDSKRLGGFRAMAGMERAVRVLHRMVHGPAATYDGLFAGISVYADGELRRPCPVEAAAKCWTPALPLPIWNARGAGGAGPGGPVGGDGDGDGEVAAWAAALRSGLDAAGIELLDLRSAVCCPGVLNQRLGSGRYATKLALEFAMIEDLIAWVHPRVAEDVQYVCGRLGGTRDAYPRMFGFLRGFPCAEWECRPRASRYVLEGLGTITFVEDAEDAHLPVGLASMVGKYVREGFVHRENLFFAGRVPGLKPTSGYHNPVTDAFVQGTAAVRKELRIPEGCFVRQR